MRRNSKPRRNWTEPDAEAVLADFAASGLSLAEFCRQRDLSRGRLIYWRERLSASTTATTMPAFVAVPVPSSAAPEAHIEIARGDIVVRVREAIDVDHLARLVAALARTSPC